jgi:hypothetical protein
MRITPRMPAALAALATAVVAAGVAYQHLVEADCIASWTAAERVCLWYPNILLDTR